MKSRARDGRAGAVLSIKKMKAGEASETCLTCHDKGHQANLAGGVHDRRGVACASCHSVHDFKSVQGAAARRPEAETCYTCHTQIRAKGMRPRTIRCAKG